FILNNLELINKYSDDFEKLYKLYSDFISHTNISAITSKEDVYRKHFEDSLITYPFIAAQLKVPDSCLEKNHENSTENEATKSPLKIIDIGTGGGFPTLPLALVADREQLNLHFTALDSTAKKLKFIEIVKEDLVLKNLNTLAARAEEITEDKRESYDIALCRSVASLPIILEICTPLIKLQGYFLAYKQCGKELEEAASAMKHLGVELIDSITYFNNEREILVFKKNQNTKKVYPRSYSLIKKSPL
ncbi:MAG: 16S rRNA (guanine(527)-N(7))-methyltransferase RsmG, partial [Proteobacteria bacterium]|nr:16S rRNA (guanine(527)-N(7))-methyltransferase RsmG [Pseudomonadota bacterium]